MLKLTTIFAFILVHQVAFCSVACEFVQLSDSPEIYECEYFLTDSECEQVIEQAKPTLRRSTVVDVISLKTLVDDRRTSLGTFLSPFSHIKAIQKIREGAVNITDLPKQNGEPIQVLYYPTGGEYKPHFDFFDTSTEGGVLHCKRGGQRVATLLVYLNTPEEGGETSFPEIGVKVKAEKGKAVLFYNMNSEGNVDYKTLHAGAPVLAGEKWIATLWIRERMF